MGHCSILMCHCLSDGPLPSHHLMDLQNIVSFIGLFCKRGPSDRQWTTRWQACHCLSDGPLAIWWDTTPRTRSHAAPLSLSDDLSLALSLAFSLTFFLPRALLPSPEAQQIANAQSANPCPCHESYFHVVWPFEGHTLCSCSIVLWSNVGILEYLVITIIWWLRLVGSWKLQVFFAEYRLFDRALLPKRPIILRSLYIVATT